MGSSYSVEVAAMNAMMGFVVMIILVCLVGVAAQVLLGLATYNDAKARGNNDPVMWGLLVGFLGDDGRRPFVLGVLFPADTQFPKKHFDEKNANRAFSLTRVLTR